MCVLAVMVAVYMRVCNSLRFSARLRVNEPLKNTITVTARMVSQQVGVEIYFYPLSCVYALPLQVTVYPYHLPLTISLR